jgi:hypothetical protein
MINYQWGMRQETGKMPVPQITDLFLRPRKFPDLYISSKKNSRKLYRKFTESLLRSRYFY